MYTVLSLIFDYNIAHSRSEMHAQLLCLLHKNTSIKISVYNILGDTITIIITLSIRALKIN